MAFCVLLHSYKPHLVDLDLVKPGEVIHNCAIAFKAGEALGARALLDPRDLRDGKEVETRSLLTYLATLHQVLEGKGGTGEEGDSGVSSSSSGQASPVGVGVVRRRRGEERKEKEEGRRRVKSLCEGEGESAFLSAFRKFSSLTLSEGEVGWDGGGDKKGFDPGSLKKKGDASLKRLGVRSKLKEPQKRESVSRGCQTEESHLRSKHLWKRQPLTVKFAPSPPPCHPCPPPCHPQSVRPSNPAPTPPHTTDSNFYSSLHPPAPPQKQRLSMRLARIEAVRRRQSGSHIPFNSLQSGSTSSHLPLKSLQSSSHSHLPFNSLPFPNVHQAGHHQFSTLV